MSHFIVRGWWTWAAALVFLAATVVTTAGSGASNGTESYDVVIANGRVMDPASSLDAPWHAGIRAGKIAAISQS